MKYLKVIGLFSLLVFFSSCEDFFDQTTTIKIPPHTPQLGVTALWIGEGNNKLVTVFSSVGALDDESSSAVSGANIVLSENGQEIATFVEDTMKAGFYHPASAIDLTAGQTYELKVSADNFETTTAEQIMPTKPILKDAEYRQAKNKLHVTISDDSGRDFYVLGISPNGTSNDVGGYLYSETGIAEDSGLDYRRVIFGDDTFSEQDVALTLEASVNGAGSGTDSVRVYLYNVTEDYYRLDRGVNAADNADENPFAEPVILHRNFDKGFGVFALGNKASVVIPVE